ncbi:MAG: type II secretion system F family protein [Nocardioidaceae bacterium]
MSPALTGGWLAGMLALGLVIVVSRLLRRRRPSLDSRVLPYVRDVPTPVAGWEPMRRSDSASSALRAILVPALRAMAEQLERLLGGRASVGRRLRRAGSPMTVDEFRFSQVVWALVGFAAGMLVGLAGPAREPGKAVPWLLVCLGLAGAAIVAREQLLSRQVKSRENRILAEFPTVADLLALSVAAGEGPVAALDRVVSTCRGPLVQELAHVLADSRAGASMTSALDQLSLRTGLSIVARFAEGLAVAIERGTPLVDVLAAQAGDVREESKRALIETGARKEVAMMVPVVFLIMPVTLLFAFFPGVVGLDLLAP